MSGDDQLVHLSRYIHLNPVSAGLVAAPEAWAFSSYRGYISLRQGTLPRPDEVLALFPSNGTKFDPQGESHPPGPPRDQGIEIRVPR